MALAYLNPGATSLAAANWSDATGFATNATLIIDNSTATINAGLDQSGNAIDYLHIQGGAPRFSALTTIEFDAAASVSPAFLWQCGGFIRLAIESSTNDCDSMVLNGGTVIWESGEVGSYVRVVSGTVTISAGASFGASCVLIVEGGTVILDSTDTLPTIRQSGGTVVTRTTITTVNQSGGTLTYESATRPTTATLTGGVYRPIKSVAATLNQEGGRMDAGTLQRAATVDTYNVYAGAVQANTGLLTITTTNAFGRDIVATGGFLTPA